MTKQELLAAMRTRSLSRRQFSRLLASAGIALTAVPMVARRAVAEDQVTYFTWSGYDVPEFFPGYVAAHGLPNLPIFSDEEEGFQKLRAGFVADIAHPCSGRIVRWRDAGVIQPFDTAALGNWGDVFEDLKSINGAADGGQWFVPVDWGNTSIIYRADLVDIEEESWSLLWDKRYEGKLSMGTDITDTAVITGLLVGVEDPYNMTDADIAAVKAKLEEQKPLLRFYWSDPTQLEQGLATGEIVASTAWNSALPTLRAQGVDVKFMNPKEGILTWCCGAVLCADAPQPELAHELVNALISPEAGEWLINYGYGHSNKVSFTRVTPELLADRGFPADPTEYMKKGIFSRDNKRLDDLQQMFEAVMAGT